MYPESFLPHILSLIPNDMPGRALDIGSGRGRNSLYLTRAGWAVLSLDPSIRRLQDSSKSPDFTIQRMDLVLGRGERLPVKDEVFQLALCTHVLESLPPNVAQEIIDESRRVMARGGFVFVATAASDDSTTTQYIDGVVGRSHLYGEAEFLELLTGFDLIELLNLKLVRPKSTPPAAQWIFIGRKS